MAAEIAIGLEKHGTHYLLESNPGACAEMLACVVANLWELRTKYDEIKNKAENT